MSTKFRKFVSVLLACVMIFSLCGLTAFAEDNSEPTATKNADVSEAPAAAPSAAVTEAPKSEETPTAVETSPTTEETPANVTESPKAEASPAATESPANSESPKAEPSPAVSETPTATAAPTEVAPSVRITGSDTAGGVTVNVDAPEGAFPAGTTLKITPISGIKNFLDIPMNKIENSVEDELADSSDLTGAVAFDITFTDQNGKEIQPDAAYPVSVTFTVGDAADALGDPDQLQAFHMENTSDKNPQAVSAPVDVKPETQNEVKVDATQFSIYVIAGQKAPKTITYQFHVGSNIVSTQIVKKGDTLNQPESPATESGKAFKGWFSAAEGGEAFTGFGLVDEIAESETIDLFAQYTEGFTVTYMDNSGRAFKTMLVSKNGSADLSVKFDVDATHSVTGWATSEADAAAGTALKTLTVNADATLYPIIRSGHWLTFDTNGGSPIDPQFVADGSKTGRPENDPVRTGYDFKDWYTASTGNSKYSFNHTLSNNETAYAQWTGKKVSFTINYWKETLTDGEYAFIESSSGSANAGDTVSARTNAKNYKYFTYNSAKSNDVTVNADGTTVLNIYYTRNTYTFKFLLNGGSSTGTSYTTMTINGVTYYANRSEYYTFSAKYGADISSLWPTKANIGIHPDTNGVTRTADANKFHGWQLNGRGTCFSSTRWNVTDEMISNDANNAVQAYYGSWSNDLHSVTLHYYLQNINDEQYTEYTPYTQEANTPDSFDAKDIAGFTHVSEKDSYADPVYKSGHIDYYRTYNFYYTRNTYDISFNTNGGTVPVPSIQSVKFGAALDGYSLPVSYQEGTTTKTISGRVYTFSGWYTGTDTKVTSFSGMAMPQSGLLLTAKWTTDEINVTFDYNDGKTPASVVPVGYNETVSEPATPTCDGYRFAGWMKDENAYNFAAKVASSFTLTARWIKNGNLTVVYNANGGTGSVSDTAKYAEDAAAKVLPDSGLTAPDGKLFIGWTDKAGTLYYPGQFIELRADLIESNSVTLTAKWADPKETTTVTYKAGDGTGSDYQLTYAINEGFALYNNQNPDHLFTKPGYAFNGWSDGTNTYTLADISSNTYGADNQQIIPNVLTAQWRKLAIVSYDANGGSGTMASQTVAEDNTAVVSENGFTSSDSTFIGWNTEADGTGTPYAPGATLTTSADLTLYARWHKIVTYTITYHSNYNPDTTTTDPVSENTTATIKAALTRAAYTFTGWNTQADGKGTPYTPGATFTPTADLILHAQWSAIDKLGFYIRNDGKVQPEGALYNSSDYTTVVNKDTQTFDYTKAGVSFSTGSNPSLFVTSDSTVRSALTAAGSAIPTAEAVFNACKNSIATFDGGTIDYANLTAAEFARDYEIQWYVLKCQVNDSWHVDGVIVKKPTYAVTYSWTNNPTGTTLPTDSNAYHTGDAVTADSTYKQGDSVTINHVIYTFSGWTPTGLTDGKVGASNVTMSGSWSTSNEASYKVTYDLNGGSSSAQLIYDGLYSGDSTPKIADPEKADTAEYTYTFAGWSPAVSDTVSGDATYVAQWTSTKRSYNLTVQYVNEKGENIVPVSTTSYAYGTPYITGPLTPAQLTGAYADYKLSSQPGNAMGTITGPTTVVYTYIPKNSYSVTVNYLDKATGKAIPAVSANVTSYLEGASYDVTTAANLDITGYTRAEDNDESSYTGTVFNSSIVIDVYYNINTYTVTYEFRGSVPTDAQLPTTDETYDYGAPFTAVQPKVVTGYTFDGWYLEKNENVILKAFSSLASLFGVDDSEQDKYTGGIITNNITLYGTWTANTHSVKYMLDGSEYAAGDYAGDKTFGTEQTVAPKAAKAGYTVSDWTANGVTVTEGKYSMPDNDVVFTATSGINTYTVTTKITNGTITPTATVNYDGAVNVTYSANPGYYISGIKVDDSSVSTSTYANGYTFSNVKADHSIEVVCTAYGGGYVEPSTSPTSIPDSEPPKDDKPSTSPSAPASSGTTIPDDDVPQGDQPSANVPDDDTPTADAPVTIPDGSTPTAAKPATPKTGDNSHATLFSILAAISAAGLAAIGITGKKRKQNEGK